MVTKPAIPSASTALSNSEQERRRARQTFSVGPYEVHDFIGASKTGHVFRARHEQLQHTVALKVLPLPTTQNETDKKWSVDATSRFTKHIESASRVVHDNVVRPIHVGEQNDVHYVAMEYVDGVSLKKILQREGTLRPELACEITLQIANGLQQIHENGLVHGAIQPANVLLTEDGKFKILELGISDITSDSASDGGEEERYLAPEQLNSIALASHSAVEDSQYKPDARVDVFSLGCILYELVYGAPAFANGERKSLPSGLRGGQQLQLSAMLLATLSGMLAFDPNKRIQSATDVIHAMRNWADSGRVNALVSSHIHQSDIWDVSDSIAAATTGDVDASSQNEEDAGKNPFQENGCSDDDWGEAVDWALLEEADWQSEGSPQQLVPYSVPNRNLTPVNVAIVSAIFAIASLGSLALIGFRSEPANPSPASSLTAQQVVEPVEIDTASVAVDSAKVEPVEVLSDEPLRGSYHDRLANYLQLRHGLPAGQWVLSNNENTCINDAVHYGHIVTQASIYGMEFTRSVQMIVEDRGGAAWDAGYFVPGIDGLKVDDRLLLVVWLRTDSVQGQRGKTGTLRLFCEEEDTDEKDFYVPVRPTSEWRRYLIPFRSRSDGLRRVGFHLAYAQQTIEFGGLALLNFGDSVPFAHLPHELHSEESLGLSISH